jgi:ribose 5-phosphate isomerase B
MTRAHNDSNILCLGGRITGDMLAMDILEAWLHTEYEGGRHDISLGLIKEAESQLCVHGCKREELKWKDLKQAEWQND